MNKPDKPHSKKAMIKSLIACAKIMGCTCDPTVRVIKIGAHLYDGEVAHDAWCKHPSQRGAS